MDTKNTYHKCNIPGYLPFNLYSAFNWCHRLAGSFLAIATNKFLPLFEWGVVTSVEVAVHVLSKLRGG